jgi:hypothetical protein
MDHIGLLGSESNGVCFCLLVRVLIYYGFWFVLLQGVSSQLRGCGFGVHACIVDFSIAKPIYTKKCTDHTINLSASVKEKAQQSALGPSST